MTSFIDDNGNELQYDGKDFGLTKQTISFLDFKIKGDVSLNLKLRNTSHNREALGYAGYQQLVNGAFSRKPFNVVRNGSASYRGYIVILTDVYDDKREIECAFISGNANWFSSFQFMCNEVQNPIYSIHWEISSTANAANDNRNNMHGIIFPFIDFVTRGERAESLFGIDGFVLNPESNDVAPTTEDRNNGRGTDMFPCLYVHTLLEEVSKLSGVNITGDLLRDTIFNTLIITPDGPELIEPTTGQKIFFGIPSIAGMITIGSIAPKIKAIDFIKWLCFSFGCVPVYDTSSNQLSLNIIANFDKSDAEDWTPYLKSYEIEYNRIQQKNFIENTQPQELEIQQYNSGNDIAYGDLLIQSGVDNPTERTVYKSPFGSSKDVVKQDTKLMWATPIVEFYDLEELETVAYTSVVLNGVIVQFVGATVTFVPPYHFLAYIKDDNNIYSGYCFMDLNVAPVEFSARRMNFRGTSTGKITLIRMSYKSPGHKVLRAAIQSGGILTAFFLTPNNPSGVWYESAAAASLAATPAFYSKPSSIHSELNKYKQGISYGEINLDKYFDKTLGETYLLPIKKMLEKPPIRAMMMLPESVFNRFNFDRFIYLNNGNINAYFFANKIEAYNGADRETAIDLLEV